MEKILGIDLGTNSIGWAIRLVNNELENQIIDKGVLTFDKGVAEEKNIESPMVQKRTEARGKRRNYQAEKYRKWELLKCLINEKMCPLSIEELDEWREYKKGVGRKYPQRKEFIDWLRFDFDGDGKPDFERLGYSKHESYYLFRELIIDESKVEIFKQEPHIIGRVLYQMVQRRGYNDGDNIEEEEKKLTKLKEEDKNKIQPFINKYKTLGAALYNIQKEQNVRIRKRYNLRSDFKKEIEEICRVQGLQHLLKPICSAIIWQRPLRSQKGLVGVCTFEQNKRRCPISHPLYEEYKTWVFINNLKIRPIIENEIAINKITKEEALTNFVYPQFFKAAPDFKLTSIIKELTKVGFEITARFPKDTNVNSLSFLYKMKDIFGDDWGLKTSWENLQKGSPKNVKYDIEDLWHLHFTKKDNKETGETAFEYLKRFATQKLNLDLEKAEKFAKIRIQQGYATLSVNAIKKILPYIQKGMLYSEAIYLANLPKVMGVSSVTEDIVVHFKEQIEKIITQNSFEKKCIQVINELINDQLNAKQSERFGMDENYKLDQDDYNDIEKKIKEVFGVKSWEDKNKDEKKNAIDFITEKYLAFLQKKINTKGAYEKTERLHNKIFDWIKDTYGVPEENIKYLWHPSEQETYKKAIEKDGKLYLGSPEPISKGFKNPMALKTLHKLKRLINYLIEVGKIDADTRVVIEIARELNDANKRKAYENWQKNREAENKIYTAQIEEINATYSTNYNVKDKALIDKIRLWEEQKRVCIYTGKTINLTEVLNGTKYDYEHTIPASMSFDNEMKNLTIADKTYNQQIKQKRLPTECANYNEAITIDGILYPAIIDSMQTMFGKMTEVDVNDKRKIITLRKFEKIERLEKDLQEWKAKTSDDKQIKDNIVVRRHQIRMELEYWRSKLQSFTINEYKAGWRNSQLRDTQTITKYALPYLKTVFAKVEVQKGNITADFRKIYEVQPRFEKKDRTKHSHHAIDAAVLTLIPAASIRDKILARYNEANDNKQAYHEKPRQYNNFHQTHIIGIEREVLINYQAQHRTLKPTCKTVRKRGKVQFVKEKLNNGKWQYKLDVEGNRIPLIANGDSIRGQLHKESFYGAIMNKGELNLVERYPIATFTSINDCKHIVDDTVRQIVKDTLETRMAEGLTFDKAKLEPIPFPNGKEVIKKVRCKVAAGRGYLTPQKAIEIQKHNFASKHNYKQYIYAQNDTNTYCLYYELETENKIERAFRIVSLFELAKLAIKKEYEIYNDNYYNNMVIGKGEIIKKLPLCNILKVGTKAIFYKEQLEELKELPTKELLQRVFRIYKFNEPAPATVYVYFQNHIEARDNDILGNGNKDLDVNIFQSRVFLNSSKFKAAIEDKHFTINLDGTVTWLF